MKRTARMLSVAAVAGVWLAGGGLRGDVVTFVADRDNTLYEDSGGKLSNGSGSGLFAGKTAFYNARRRGLLAFPVGAAVPAGSTVTGVTLRLYMSRTIAMSNTVAIHRALADWGEGASVAPGQGGAGASAATNDATWLHRFYPDRLWAHAGGDFAAAASAAATVDQTGYYAWASTGMVADVQRWLDQPATNFGWLIRGDEAHYESTKRFESRESTNAAWRPRLMVQYAPPPDVGACDLGEGRCVALTAAACQAQGGAFLGEGTSCASNPYGLPAGACSLPDGTCTQLTREACLAAGGTYAGDFSQCASTPPPVVLEPFVDALPIPAALQPETGEVGGAARYRVTTREVQQKLHRDLPPTTVWGYNGLYPGPTIEAGRDLPISVIWSNDLRDAQGNLRTNHYLAVDLCLHGPDHHGATARTVTHLHGGHVPAVSDGYPEWTFMPGEGVEYLYPNNQLPATLWYHDHALGITRLNVWMGLAGFYLLRDPEEQGLGLPSGEYEIPLAVQDRTFRSDGSFFYPDMWHEHVFGDKILVNGKVWPTLGVKQGKYRFRILNGSNARVYMLSLSSGAPFWQIGTDGGLLPAPVAVPRLTLSPGERADTVVDFAGYAAGTHVIVSNSAAAPFAGQPGKGAIPLVMRFVVTNAAGHTAALPAALRPIERLREEDAVKSRTFVLRKQPSLCGGYRWLINNLGWDDIREFPVLGATEIWSFANPSGASHPMHLHLSMFQVLDRQPIAVSNQTFAPAGPRVAPAPEEAGWKDTVLVRPFETVRVIVRFEDYEGLYPYHCHILEHEDNEMMRQFSTVRKPLITRLEFAGQDAVVDFLTVSGRLHNVQRSDGLATGAWSMVGGGVMGDGTVSAMTDTNALRAPTRAYRIRAPP